MPVIKSAIKKLRQNAKKATLNRARKGKLKDVLDDFRKKPSAKGLAAAFSSLDKSLKNKVIHRNKVARLKSRMAKKIAKPSK